ncbi:MAG: GTP cyclohydrolase 1 type 2 [Bacteroidia bacterium]|nr:MAG: GTP cyclohydrolase 1 type 2 [Bacteroidia bacterium]
MTRIRDVIAAVEAWAPPQWADSYDTVGLLWGDPERPVQGILTTLDVTPELIEEAQAVGANLILAHHPIWFGPRTRLVWDTFADRVIYRGIQADIAVYAVHTNADKSPEGVNFVLCRHLNLRPVRVLQTEGPGYGGGYVGEWAHPLEPPDFLRFLQKRLDIPSLRFTPGPDRPISRVAVCGGAGSFLLPQAIEAQVEAFLTADIPYHRFFEAQGRVWLVDIGHYESEWMIAGALADLLRQRFAHIPIFTTRLRTNPVHYWI